jgi:hypothetical protein
MIISDTNENSKRDNTSSRQSSQNVINTSYTNKIVNNSEIVNKNKKSSLDVKTQLMNDFEKYLKNRKNLKETKKEKIILNARGTRYECLAECFEKLPNSRLGKLKIAIEKRKREHVDDDILTKLCDDFDLEKNEYYFNKDPYVLNVILNFYENDRLHVHDNICANFYGEELLYWEIDENSIESCCQFKYFNKKEEIFEEIKIEKKEKKELINDHQKESFDEKKRSDLIKKKIWNLMEKPSSSYFARVNKRLIFIFI